MDVKRTRNFDPNYVNNFFPTKLLKIAKRQYRLLLTPDDIHRQNDALKYSKTKKKTVKNI